MTSGVKFVSGLLVIALVTGCSSSADKNANTEAVTALQRMSSAVQDVEIVVSAGVTKEEYSKRLADALLKFGNPEDSCKLAVAKFSNLDQKALAAQACQHLSKSMAAFVYAKEYFGPVADDLDPDLLTYTLTEKEYTEAKDQFPNLAELEVVETNENGYKFYSRSAMLHALWKVAAEEEEAAKGMLGELHAV